MKPQVLEMSGMQGENFNEIHNNIITVKHKAYKFHRLCILLERAKPNSLPDQQ